MAVKMVDVPDNLYYVLERGKFEKSRSSSNVAFMLSMHANDKDDSFLKSELFKRLEERALDATIQHWTFANGVSQMLVGSMSAKYRFDRDNRTLTYEEVDNG